MKICIVVDSLAPKAGWGRLATQVGQGLVERGHKVGYVSGSGSSGESVLNLPLRGLSLYAPLTLFSTLHRLRLFIAHYDIVLCYDANPYGIIVTLASIGLPIKRIIHCLGTYSLFTKNKFRNLLIRWVYFSADSIFIVSDFVRRQIELAGYRFSNYTIIPVGVDVSVFARHPVSPEQSTTIISVGAVKSRKGYLFLLRRSRS
ncbi:glycosyltransferase [Patescibacteria group bacterium]|nr:glycosyltransferase [Patescibacteria group bacterium]